MSARHKRGVSPARPARPTASLSPTARISAKSRTSASQPSTPESSRLRSLTNSAGASLNHALSFSSLKAESASAPPVRITSKVSGVAKTVHPNDHAPTSRPMPTHRNRTPSGSSNVSVATSPPTFYPITTATPAANPYRYAPPRAAVSRLGSPFGILRVDPSTPPLSPPISSISISSQSSAASHAAKDGCSSSPEISPAALARTSSMHGHHRSSSESQDNDWGEDDDDSEERKVKAAAKSNRKIEDLEITNRSLMAINASLEKTKNKQAKEIRELRRKLRESRLILPPHTYKAVKSSPDHDDTADDDEDDDRQDDDDVEETEDTDDVFLRLKAIVENLLESGRRALETKVADFGGVGSAAKVLSAEEARSWRDDDPELDQPPSPSRIAVPDSDDDDDTPLDDEDMIPSSPPIFITPSP